MRFRLRNEQASQSVGNGVVVRWQEISVMFRTVLVLVVLGAGGALPERSWAADEATSLTLDAGGAHRLWVIDNILMVRAALFDGDTGNMLAVLSGGARFSHVQPFFSPMVRNSTWWKRITHAPGAASAPTSSRSTMAARWNFEMRFPFRRSTRCTHRSRPVARRCRMTVASSRCST